MDRKSDSAVQATNDDATQSKASAIKRGYWNDNYIQHFCAYPSRKTPEIHRGYFIRVQAFKAITMRFIKDHGRMCQIVNLGAGSDTLYFQLRDEDLLPRKFVEIDLAHNVNKKISVIASKNLLNTSGISGSELQGDTSVKSQSPNAARDRPALSADPYHLLSFDLREPMSQLIEQLCAPDFGIQLDRTLPTLFLSECVLVYLKPEDSMRLIQAIPAYFTHSVFLLYEQVNMSDRFGAIMLDNFRKRGCDLPGLPVCQTLQSQERRFLDAGWKKAESWTINQIYQSFSGETRSRIEKVEFLDEMEVSQQLFDHYCIVLAVTDESLCPWSGIDVPLSLIP